MNLNLKKVVSAVSGGGGLLFCIYFAVCVVSAVTVSFFDPSKRDSRVENHYDISRNIFYWNVCEVGRASDLVSGDVRVFMFDKSSPASWKSDILELSVPRSLAEKGGFVDRKQDDFKNGLKFSIRFPDGFSDDLIVSSGKDGSKFGLGVMGVINNTAIANMTWESRATSSLSKKMSESVEDRVIVSAFMNKPEDDLYRMQYQSFEVVLTDASGAEVGRYSTGFRSGLAMRALTGCLEKNYPG